MQNNKSSATLNRRGLSSLDSNNESLQQLLKHFPQEQHVQLLIKIVNEELKCLQKMQSILDERLALDRQYAQKLQELTINADRFQWPSTTHSIGSACREMFIQWSYIATNITGNADRFRDESLQKLLKDLIENKNDSKKFLEDEQRKYEGELLKAHNDLADAGKRYRNEAKAYATKDAELKKAAANARLNDGDRLKDIKQAVVKQRDAVFHAHNDYIFAIDQCQFIHQQSVRNFQRLVAFHEETQIFLNTQWRNLIEAIGVYSFNHPNNTGMRRETLEKIVNSADPQHCYDRCYQQNSSPSSPVLTPISFDESLLKLSGLTHLKPDEIFIEHSTNHNTTLNSLKQKVKQLTEDLSNDARPSSAPSASSSTSYTDRQRLFQQKQQQENLQLRLGWQEKMRKYLEKILNESGIADDDDDDKEKMEIPASLSEKLEDQSFFHGRMPRDKSVELLEKAGDFLLRINDQSRIVVSTVWNDPDNPNKMKDGHFIIVQDDTGFHFPNSQIIKSSVPNLIIFHMRQRIPLRDDGTRLIRPIERPNFIINNVDVKIIKNIGSGNFGEVALGEYRNTRVAIKMLKDKSGSLPPKARANFIEEALILKKYKHKNIVSFIGIAAYSDPLMILMEYVEQGSLDNYIKSKDLRVSEMTQMSLEIAEGMEYLESRRVIHRDLAARNCLVDKKGQVKVSDFGLSRCLVDDEIYIATTIQIPVRWWAVEVLFGEPYTHKADVWSYGVTIWEIFAKGVRPYAEIVDNRLLQQDIRHGERLKQPEKCPANIFTIMTSCWLREPADRPTFAEIVKILKKQKSSFPKFPFLH